MGVYYGPFVRLRAKAETRAESRPLAAAHRGCSMLTCSEKGLSRRAGESVAGLG